MFWPKFPLKGYFRSKTDKMNSTFEFGIFKLIYVSNFTLSKTFWIFEGNLPKNCIFRPNQKSKQHHLILHIRISLSNKFQLQMTILIFWTKFAQKRYFWSKTAKMNSIFKFCIFKLIQVSNFTLNKQFSNFEQFFKYPVKTEKVITEFCIFELV